MHSLFARRPVIIDWPLDLYKLDPRTAVVASKLLVMHLMPSFAVTCLARALPAPVRHVCSVVVATFW